MTFRLGPRARAAGYDLHDFDAVGSTNAAALAGADAGELGPAWFVTADQTGGRGRRGRPWQGRPGNLAASILLTVDRPAAVAATIGFVAGIALCDAIDAVAPGAGGEHVSLKWPNDALLGGAKVAGILLEARAREGATTIVAGIGVNVASSPEDTPYPATHLQASMPGVTAEDLFAALSDAWVESFAAWQAHRGFLGLRDRWIARASGIGAPVSVSIAERTVRGIFETVDDDGHLVVRTADGGREVIAAGEVHFGAAATTRS
jgi:BirA family biotin operon repressor/biotin-[acetyl-CoA-carboxylase] ligase